MIIRKYKESDSQYIVDILRLNNQYHHSRIEGSEAMNRVAKCEAAISLVAEIDNQIAGYIKAIYDGSRALIHLLTVHPNNQNSEVGSTLLKAVERELKKRGAQGTTVSVTEKSADYWKKKGFKPLPVFLMLKEFE
jgi:N-acetylglutamate synthase-like GNAT family acetyltransferase